MTPQVFDLLILLVYLLVGCYFGCDIYYEYAYSLDILDDDIRRSIFAILCVVLWPAFILIHWLKQYFD